MSDIVKAAPSALLKAERGLKKLENEVYQEATELLYTAMTHSFDLQPTEEGCDTPPEWLDELDMARTHEERARVMRNLDKRKRIAMCALQSPKDAPVAFALAKAVFVGMQRARAMEGSGNRTLNVNLVSITAPMPVIPGGTMTIVFR